MLGFAVVNEKHRKERNSYKLDLKVGEHCVTEPEACGLRHLAFAVSDIESCAKELLDKGIQCEPIRVDGITGKQFTFFRDPDGLPIELYAS